MTPTRYQLTPVPFTAVHFSDPFWTPRIETNRTATIPHIYYKLEETGRISAFDLNFERPVPSPIVLIFGDSDTAKWIEAASYSLATHSEPELAGLVERVVDKVIAAQQPDGYLNTHFTRAQPGMRWKNLRDWHELYCAGHLIESAVAHQKSTGERKLLDALARYADHIDGIFGLEPGKKPGYCGHPEIELALVRLHHATGDRRYLELSKYFVEERGQHGPGKPHYFDNEAYERGDDPAKFWAKTYEYCQAQVPVRQQEKVVGHAVRAMYLLCAMTDLASEYEDPTLKETCDRLWDNLLNKRMYLTGGIGPSRHNEGFTMDYDLPDETAYAETCATIGLMLWNYRMLQFDGQCKYADVIERGLYNGFLSGVSLDGTHFFYENPLASAGEHHRVEWFNCPCCPPNVARILANVGSFFYSTSEDGLWVHLFAQGQATIEIGQVPITIRQETSYPWSGAVRFGIDIPSQQAPWLFTLYLRLPGWCKGYTLKINGSPYSAQAEASGYLAIRREWQSGDQVDYEMEMPIRPVYANPAVRLLEGRIAIQRGPLVYCLEGVDNGGILLDRISLDPQMISRTFAEEYRPDLLGGVTVIHGKGYVIDATGWHDELYREEAPTEREVEITAVPYCVWDNRALGEMRVWLRARSN